MNEALRKDSACLRKRCAEMWGGQAEGRGGEKGETLTLKSQVQPDRKRLKVHNLPALSPNQCLSAAQHTGVSAIPMACSLTQTAALLWPHIKT